MNADGDKEIERITEGVFFTTPAMLPRGKHDMARDDIVAAQKERMMIAAAAEILCAYGSSALGPKSITTRAGVGLGAYYQHYASLDDLVCEASNRFIAGIVNQFALAASKSGTRSFSERAEELLDRVVCLFESDPVCSKAFLYALEGFSFETRIRFRECFGFLAQSSRLMFSAPEPGEQEGLRQDVSETAIMGWLLAADQLIAQSFLLGEGHCFSKMRSDLKDWLAVLVKIVS